MSVERIQALKDKLKRAETAKITAEANLQTAEEQLAAVTADMKELGVTPDTIEQEIKVLQEFIDSDLARLEGLIPDV